MKNTEIAWADNTQNFFEGCDRVSPGCRFCYADRIMTRWGKDFSTLRRVSQTTFTAPLRWKQPSVIFTCSTSDFFHKGGDPHRNDAWDVIRASPHHLYLILTKRTNRIPKCLPHDWGNGWPNVKIGFSAENQKMLMRRLADVADIPTHNKFFISGEPMLSEMDFVPAFNYRFENLFDWIILGGESGNKEYKGGKSTMTEFLYRRCELSWMEKAINQCKDAGVKVFVKQTGTYISKQLGLAKRHGTDLTEEKIPAFLKIQETPDHFKLKPKTN